MKILKLSVLTIFLILLFSGCSQKFTHIDKEQVVTSLDFTKYQEKGFLITPGEFGEDYEAIGLFDFTIFSEANYVYVKDKIPGQKVKKWVSKYINPQEVLDFAYQTAVKKGANAITHFKIKPDKEMRNDGKQNFYIDSLSVSGLLIKRK